MCNPTLYIPTNKADEPEEASFSFYLPEMGSWIRSGIFTEKNDGGLIDFVK